MKKPPPLPNIPLPLRRSLKSFIPTSEPDLKGSNHIAVSEPNLTQKEKSYLMKAFSSSWLSSSGEYVNRFEDAFARHVSHTKRALAVNSGTSALHIAIASLGIKPGDEVILPAFTMIATINSVSYTGATPVLADSDPHTWNMDINQIEAAITPKTRAIIVVHTYGAPVQMDSILQFARRHNLWIIEDAAEAHGASWKGQSVGGIGHVGAFSLYANKLITTGEGGIVTTNNPHIVERIALLRNHAFARDRHFWHRTIGYGYRLTNLQAAVGLAQVERIDSLLRIKRANAALYNEGLSNIPGLILPFEAPDAKHSYWMYGILVNRKQFGMSRDALRTYLASRGIETRSFFTPLHFQPAYFEMFKGKRFPVAESLGKDGLYLPSSTTLKRHDIGRICETIKRAHMKS